MNSAGTSRTLAIVSDPHDDSVVPTVTGVSPNGSASVDGGETVTISGTGFLNVTTVGFAGYGCSYEVVDDNTIVAVAPAYDGTIGSESSFVSVFNGSLAGDSRDLGEWTWGGQTS